MGLFENKVVIITGAGRGIGKAHALSFAKEGAKIVANDLGSELDGSGSSIAIADQVVNEIRSLGGDAIANYDSVTTMEGGRNIIHTAIDEYGRIDVLVNNAGILRDKSFLKMEEEMWDSVVNVHLKGTFVCTQAAARYLREQMEGGSIINTTSFSGLIGNFGQSNYGAAKMGIVGLTKVLAIELERYSINVNCIAPLAKTRMKSPIVSNDMTPEKISSVVLYLASEFAEDITGKIIGIHGSKIFEYAIKWNEGVEKAPDKSWSVEEIAENFDEITRWGN